MKSENEMTVNVPEETADYLLRQIIHLNEKITKFNQIVDELKIRIKMQADNIISYERNKEKLESEIKELKSQLKSKKKLGEWK